MTTLIDEVSFRERLNTGIVRDYLDQYRITGDLQLVLLGEINAMYAQQTQNYERIVQALQLINQEIIHIHLTFNELRIELNQMKGSIENVSHQFPPLHSAIKEVQEEVQHMNELTIDRVSSLSEDILAMRSEIQEVQDEIRQLKEPPKAEFKEPPKAELKDLSKIRTTLPSIRVESVKKIPPMKKLND